MAVKPQLSRDRILDAALALVEADGLEALSMRRLAQELDVWPMSLYRYFQDKEALLEALAQAVAEEIAVPATGGSWRSQMRDLLHSARDAFGRHPGTLQLGVGASRLSDGGVPILEAAGLRPAAARKSWQALLAYTAGAAASPDFDYGLDLLLDGIDARIGSP